MCLHIINLQSVSSVKSSKHITHVDSISFSNLRILYFSKGNFLSIFSRNIFLSFSLSYSITLLDPLFL